MTKRRTSCRCCGGKKLLLYLDLGKQPLANSYHQGQKLQKYPLEVMLCPACFHSQLSIVIDRDLMFKNYLYVSGTTETFRNHCRELAEDAVSRFSGKLKVLDIACNDGTQLEYFRKLGYDVFGVDPAENLRDITKSKNIPVEVAYWSKKIARKLNQKFDIITATNVFAHVDNLDEFLEASRLALTPQGILILEFPYADKMLGNNEFDTIYHEHLSYFLASPFRALIERLNFRIVDIIQTDIHGGSIRFFLKGGKGSHSPKIYKLTGVEKKKHLLNKKSYLDFAKRVAKNKAAMVKLFEKIRSQGGKIIGYGAAAKGNTMLNFFKLTLDYIVDDNPLKWGYLTPGRNIPIYEPARMRQEKNGLHIVILSWNFYNEIVKKILAIRGSAKKDRCILYVPRVAVKSLGK